MNAHDSERLAGLLDEAGYQPAGDDETPDVVVFNTCAVRELSLIHISEPTRPY